MCGLPRAFFVVTIANFVLPLSGLAAEGLYVASYGNDQNAGTIDNPYRTITFASSRAVPGQTVFVRGGTYAEAPILTCSGHERAYITVTNFPNEFPILDPNFASQHGFQLRGCSYVHLNGFEIRNLKDDPAKTASMGGIVLSRSGSGQLPHHCTIEGNTIHHIVGGRKAARGLFVQGGHHITVQNNTIYDIVGHTESMGIYVSGTEAIIRRNLTYLCDKEGIRLITGTTETDSIIEGNIALSCHYGIDLNSCFATKSTTTVRDNFCGRNWGVGSMPKHTTNAVVEHNTFYTNDGYGLDIHGGAEGNNDRPVVKNNLFIRNYCSWWLFDEEVSGEVVDYNFYDQALRPLGRWNWGAAEMPISLAQMHQMTAARDTLNGPYEQNGKEGDPAFVNSAGGDFRLQAGSPASAGAEDGRDMGAHADVLSQVGADKSYGLARIPDLGELKLHVASSSSEHRMVDEASPFRPLTTGLAAHAVDRASVTYWQVDTTTDTKRELVLDLVGNQNYALTYITITKYHGQDTHFYKQFELFVDDGSGVWKPVPEPVEHPFNGYAGNNNGETWRMPESTMARRVKLRLISGHGDVVQIPEIRLYGDRARR